MTFQYVSQSDSMSPCLQIYHDYPPCYVFVGPSRKSNWFHLQGIINIMSVLISLKTSVLSDCSYVKIQFISIVSLCIRIMNVYLTRTTHVCIQNITLICKIYFFFWYIVKTLDHNILSHNQLREKWKSALSHLETNLSAKDDNVLTTGEN